MEQNNPVNQTPPQPIPPQESPQISKKSTTINIFLGFLVFLLLLTNAATIYYLYNKNKNSNQEVQEKTNNVKVIEENNKTDEIVKNENDEIRMTANEVLIEWYEQPSIANTEDLFGEERIAQNKSKASYSILDNDVTIEKLGTIGGGVFEGAELYSLTYQSMMVAQTYFLKINDEVYLIDKDENYNNCDSDEYKYLCEDKSIKIKNLETPDIIEIPNNTLKLIKKEYTDYQKIDSIDGYKILFEYSPGKYLYEHKNPDSKSMKYFALAEDGSIRLYQLDLSFLGEAEKESQYFGAVPLKFTLTWNDNIVNDDSFLQDIYGSYRASHPYANYINSVEDLKITGHLTNGDPIYELKNSDKKINPNDNESLYQTMYNRYYVPKEEDKISFNDFIKEHLVIFWKDPFGNFIEFNNSNYMPAAEFGKPVIYLYPEKTTDISVKVYPNNGLTITEPSYKNGWLVKAEPNGTLYNYDDNKNYPYLFWEGHGLNYEMPENGFVITKDNVEKFLVEKLKEQGLKKHEYDEFIDFWLPKMQEDDYYFITFMEQSKFDKLAPLDINPKPDTIIRVFMDYKGLDEYTKVSPQYFKTPTRDGFTVVEWGGALHE